MAIGTSYILGIRTPENFNKPFISKDIKEFWDRWHITLSHWFRDFLFSRYMMSALRSKKFKNRLNAASAGFIINMFVMGIWHGLSKDYFVVWTISWSVAGTYREISKKNGIEK